MKQVMKKLLKVIPAVCLGLSVLLLLVSFGIKDIPEKKTYHYQDHQIITTSWHTVFELGFDGILMGILLAAVAGTVMGIIVHVRYKEPVKKDMLRIWGTEGGCFLLLSISLFCVIGMWSEEDYYPECYEFTDGKHSIVVEEKSFLLSGGGTVYQLTNQNEAVILNEFTTDDGGRNKGNYDIIWHDAYAEITFRDFISGTSRSTVRITFID